MRRIGIIGDIGSGKSYISSHFGYPVFNADKEVENLYRKNKRIFSKLKKTIPNYINSFPIDKKEISSAILNNKNNLKKIIKIIHPEVRGKMQTFLNKNKNKQFVILDIPLLLENKIANKNDILIFVETRKNQVFKRLKMRKNFNQNLLNKFKKIQMPLDYKRKKSDFIIKNDFTKKTIVKNIKNILDKINK